MAVPIPTEHAAAAAGLSPRAIAATYARIAASLRRTPVIDADGADFGLPGVRLNFKLEFMQHAGSFKARGAFSNLLGRDVPVAGVVAASGGNHGAAVAFAARQVGAAASIYVPTVASPAKLERIRGYGARLVVGGDRYVEALAASQLWAAESGALPIHAYDQIETLQGQATLGLEWEQQTPHLDTLLIAVGGGGLIGGLAAWYAGRARLIGVEPELAPTLARALQAGQPVDAPAGGIAADSLAPLRVGAMMFPLAQQYVSDVLLVSDEAIVAAQQMLWSMLRVVVEPGGAAALAPLLTGQYRPAPGERVGVLLCGANTTTLPETKLDKC